MQGYVFSRAHFILDTHQLPCLSVVPWSRGCAQRINGTELRPIRDFSAPARGKRSPSAETCSSSGPTSELASLLRVRAVQGQPEAAPCWTHTASIHDQVAISLLVEENHKGIDIGLPNPPARHKKAGVFLRSTIQAAMYGLAMRRSGEERSTGGTLTGKVYSTEHVRLSSCVLRSVTLTGGTNLRCSASSAKRPYRCTQT